MRQLSITPRLTVTIGRQTRIYLAFVTSAPAELDSPATVTLDATTFSEVVGVAADPVTDDEVRGQGTGRLVFVDATELAWQQAKYHGHQHPLLPADPVLVGVKTLPHWLCQRVQATNPANGVAA